MLCWDYCFVSVSRQAFKNRPAGKRSKEQGWHFWQDREQLAVVDEAGPSRCWNQSPWPTLEWVNLSIIQMYLLYEQIFFFFFFNVFFVSFEKCYRHPSEGRVHTCQVYPKKQTNNSSETMDERECPFHEVWGKKKHLKSFTLPFKLNHT